MDWTKAKTRKPGDAAFPKDKQLPGGWSHVKRGPVRTLTDAEKRAFLANRPDLSSDH